MHTYWRSPNVAAAPCRPLTADSTDCSGPGPRTCFPCWIDQAAARHRRSMGSKWQGAEVPLSERRRRRALLVAAVGLAVLLAACAGPGAVQQELSSAQSAVVAVPPLSTASATSAGSASATGAG